MSFQWFKKSSVSSLQNNSHDTQKPETSKGTGASKILDVLNSDCWKVILDKLDINDVIRSERVSHGWQRVVLEYLQGVHNFGIRNAGAQRPRSSHFWQSKYKNSRLIHIHFQNKDFDLVIQKIGPFVAQLTTDCISDRSLMAIAECCPNIECLGFHDINFEKVNLTPTTSAFENAVESFNSLKRISFDTCRQVQHFCSCMFTKNKTFEELVFINSCSSYIIELALNFWLDFKWTDLKSANLSRLDTSESSLIEWSGIEIASVNWKTKLTKLQLDDNSMKIFHSLNGILENVLNLELLSLCGYDKYYPHYHRKDIVLVDDSCCSRIRREWNDALVESIGLHSGLKHLYLARNDNVDNEWLEILGRRCKELRTLDIGSCKAVSSLGALQSLAPTLEKLSLPDNILVTDTDLIDCVTACYRLRFLDVSRCSGATPRLVQGAERATRHRAPPLQLRLDETDMSTVQILKAAGFEIEMQKRRESYPWYLPQEIQVRHKGLTLHWSNKAPEAHLPLRGPLAAEYRYDSVLRQGI